MCIFIGHTASRINNPGKKGTLPCPQNHRAKILSVDGRYADHRYFRARPPNRSPYFVIKTLKWLSNGGLEIPRINQRKCLKTSIWIETKHGSSVCCPQTSPAGIFWDPVRNAHFQASPQTCWTGSSGVGPSHLCCDSETAQVWKTLLWWAPNLPPEVLAQNPGVTGGSIGWLRFSTLWARTLSFRIGSLPPDRQMSSHLIKAVVTSEEGHYWYNKRWIH